MQNGSTASFDTEPTPSSCPFCQHTMLNEYILKETPTFLIVADHAPLIEGHILIIPKTHYACYGAVPAELDAELLTLKHEVQTFLTQYYAPVIFWEHGVFRQTVFHAHLHCFPFGEIRYDASQDLSAHRIHTQEDIRSWYGTHGHYTFLQDSDHSYLFPAKPEIYQQVIQQTLRAGVIARNGHRPWRNSQQRREEGIPLIANTSALWRTFQQQGANYAYESNNAR